LLQCVATHYRGLLQCVAVRCSALQCVAVWVDMDHVTNRSSRSWRDPYHNTLQHTATHCNTLQHTATHCNTLQHTATHCNTLQHMASPVLRDESHECRWAQLISHDMTRAGAVCKCWNRYTHNIGPWHVYTKRITRRHKRFDITRTCNLSHFILTYGINLTHRVDTEYIHTYMYGIYTYIHPIPSHPHVTPL